MNIQEVIFSVLAQSPSSGQVGEKDAQKFEEWMQFFEQSQSQRNVPFSKFPLKESVPVLPAEEEMRKAVESVMASFLWTVPREAALADSENPVLTTSLSVSRVEAGIKEGPGESLPEEIGLIFPESSSPASEAAIILPKQQEKEAAPVSQEASRSPQLFGKEAEESVPFEGDVPQSELRMNKASERSSGQKVPPDQPEPITHGFSRLNREKFILPPQADGLLDAQQPEYREVVSVISEGYTPQLNLTVGESSRLSVETSSPPAQLLQSLLSNQPEQREITPASLEGDIQQVKSRATDFLGLRRETPILTVQPEDSVPPSLPEHRETEVATMRTRDVTTREALLTETAPGGPGAGARMSALAFEIELLQSELEKNTALPIADPVLPLQPAAPESGRAMKQEAGIQELTTVNFLPITNIQTEVLNTETQIPQQLIVTSPEQFVHEMTETLHIQLEQRASPGAIHKVHIRLAPEALGQMEIQMEWGQEQTTISITVENEGIKQLLDSQRSWMLTQLQQSTPVQLLTVQAAPEMSGMFFPVRVSQRDRTEANPFTEQQSFSHREKKKSGSRKNAPREGARHFNLYI